MYGTPFISPSDASVNASSVSAIAIGTDGLPMISYYDATADDLKVIKCGNADCSSGNALNTVDSTGNVGLFSAIAIGLDGNPIIAYYLLTGPLFDGDYKVAKCANPACSGASTITVFDPAPRVPGEPDARVPAGARDHAYPSSRRQWPCDVVSKCANAACRHADRTVVTAPWRRLRATPRSPSPQRIGAIAYGGIRPAELTRCPTQPDRARRTRRSDVTQLWTSRSDRRCAGDQSRIDSDDLLVSRGCQRLLAARHRPFVSPVAWSTAMVRYTRSRSARWTAVIAFEMAATCAWSSAALVLHETRWFLRWVVRPPARRSRQSAGRIRCRDELAYGYTTDGGRPFGSNNYRLTLRFPADAGSTHPLLAAVTPSWTDSCRAAGTRQPFEIVFCDGSRTERTVNRRRGLTTFRLMFT